MHLRRFLLLCAAFGGLSVSIAQEAPRPAVNSAAASAGADRDWQAYQDFLKRPAPAGIAQGSRREQMEYVENRALELQKLGIAFIETHPNDPRRWNVVLALNPLAPRFIKELGAPDANGVPTVTVDEPAVAAWKAKVADLKAAMAKASPEDRPADVNESLDWTDFAKDFRATTAAKNSGQPFDYTPFRARFDAHAAKYATLPNLPARARDYLGALENSLPGAGLKEWNYLLMSPREPLRQTAQEQIAKLGIEAARKADLASKPLEIAFTAVDGREVDLKKLRGKVVLVDFWATWCGPCIAELPNIKRVYAAYHAKGFEIVGISLENGSLLPTDTPEQTEKKLAKEKKVLTDFTAKEEMPWPQHFDGKYWKNDISTSFAINAIPAMFLLDKEGKVVSTNARGELLEKEVKRLLGL
jgi:thiol-disulfide isomerase/thioredoxin